MSSQGESHEKCIDTALASTYPSSLKAQDPISENSGGEAGGYASYMVGQIRLLLGADIVHQERVTELV